MVEKKNLNVQIGEKVKLFREDAGYTQERLAELCDVSPQYISGLERGAVGISIHTLIRLCEVLVVSSDAILMEECPPNDVSGLVERLRRLPEEQVAIVEEIINKHLEGVAAAQQRCRRMEKKSGSAD